MAHRISLCGKRRDIGKNAPLAAPTLRKHHAGMSEQHAVAAGDIGEVDAAQVEAFATKRGTPPPERNNSPGQLSYGAMTALLIFRGTIFRCHFISWISPSICPK